MFIMATKHFVQHKKNKMCRWRRELLNIRSCAAEEPSGSKNYPQPYPVASLIAIPCGANPQTTNHS